MERVNATGTVSGHPRSSVPHVRNVRKDDKGMRCLFTNHGPFYMEYNQKLTNANIIKMIIYLLKKAYLYIHDKQ